MRPRGVRTMTATLVVVLLAGCAPHEGFILRGVALAGPTCPVVTQPPDPACADRPVAGARILVFDAAGSELASLVTTEDGSFSVELPAGSYQLVPQAVTGLMGNAPPITVEVGGDTDPGLVTVSYDTGIR